MATFIDRFQATMAELEAISPDDYSDSRKKRMLLTSIKTASGVAHLIQTCRDKRSMTYEECARYLRTNSILIDNQNAVKAPTKLMHTVKETIPVPDEGKTAEQVVKLFHTIALENGVSATYRMFNTRSFRDSMTIPTAIWFELEPQIREKVNEARERAKAKKGIRPIDKNQSSYNNNKPIDKSQGYSN